MKLTFLQLVLGLGFTSCSMALPPEDLRLRSFLATRAVTVDGTCGNIKAGNNNGYTCNPNTGGFCCSQNGWCGKS